MRGQIVGETELKHSGTGPGAQTIDGCSVDFYAQLPARADELTNILKGLTPPATLLELGSGVGRLTRPLSKAGFTVTAVDNSEAMLNKVTQAETVLADIETLDLGITFDGVLLASRLLNTPKVQVRDRLLAAARRHLETGSIVIAEVQDASLLQFKAGDGSRGTDYSAVITSSDINGSIAKITIEYQIGKDRWTQSFEAEYLPLAAIKTLLTANGFLFETWLDESSSWLKAIAV